MGFKIKLILWIVAIELLLFFAVGSVFVSNLGSGGWEASLPLFYELGIVMLVGGGLIAVVIAALTAREIGKKTGAMQEGWTRSLKIFHSIPVGVVIIDPENHRIVDANKAALKAFKASKRRVIGHICHKYLCPAEEGYCPVTDLKGQMDSSERILVTAKGKTVPIYKMAVPISLKGRKHLLEIFFDISERKERERSIRDAFAHQENLANYDLLTGLLNRRAINKHAEAELSRAERGGLVSLAFLDIDHFKKINDTYGHLFGDEVLKLVSKLIMDNVRPYDWVGRWGGEEFLLVLPNTSIKEAKVVAERLRAAVRASRLPLPQRGELRFSVSLGISGSSKSEGRFAAVETLINQADNALYRAKDEGRNRVCLYGPA